MPIFDIFFERERLRKGNVADVFIYDTIPQELRIQIVHIMADAIGSEEEALSSYGSTRGQCRENYKHIVQILRREFGVFYLPPSTGNYNDNYFSELKTFIIRELNIDKLLSAVEIICKVIELFTSSRDYRYDDAAKKKADEAIYEINYRFRSHGVGYEYSGKIIRVDTAYLHENAVKPALLLLSDASFQGADAEFRNAYEHYRKGHTKEALSEALKSLESTMKIICKQKNWTISQNDTSSKLIDVCFANNLIPPYWKTHFSSLRSMLESSVPTARNKNSGHGQGDEIKVVPEYLVSYALHMTGSTIVFLINAAKST